MERFDFETNKVISEIKKRKAKRILVQLPVGVKKDFLEILKILEKETKAEVIISGENCWGACDINVSEAREVGANLIIHYGHSEFKKVNFPIIYVPLKDNFNIDSLVTNSLGEIKDYKKIVLASSVQHIHLLEEIKKFYEANGKKVIEEKNNLIGCNYEPLKKTKEKFEAVVFVGNKFHGLGASLALVDKPIILIDVYNNETLNLNELRDKILKQRAFVLEKFKTAKKIGLIQSLKPLQNFSNKSNILLLKKELEKIGKEVMIITMNEITPDKILNFYDLDAFIEFGCPRIAIEDAGRFERPILNYKEALVAIGKKSWKRLLEEGLV